MDQHQLLHRIATLESLYDQLHAEMHELNQLLIALGFEEGVKTLKSAAKELLENQSDFLQEDE